MNDTQLTIALLQDIIKDTYFDIRILNDLIAYMKDKRMITDTRKGVQIAKFNIAKPTLWTVSQPR
jgi:hypothetical protein